MSHGKEWPYIEYDAIELGDTGLIPQENGWFLDTKTGHRISPTGIVYDENGVPLDKPYWQDDEMDR